MAVSSSIPASVSSSPSTFETRTNIITPAHTHGLKAPSSYPIGLNLSKFNIGSFLKSDTGCLNAYTSISSSLNHFNPSITSTPFYFSETVSPYVPHRKRRENKPRRQRTTFSSEQTLKLEMEYRRAEYVTRTRRLELADDLQLTETQIKIWYQNRRAKDKRIEKAHIDQHFR
ncbi:hypothetical protein SNE40_009433 [Patella caerulea]|uniref:Homeobox domain-containing protein n=1 Tax=Patella caerulea TaxID=87958 RepID=A0AAN8JS66_PATCE